MPREEHRKLLKRFEVEGEYRFLTFSCYQRLPLFKNDHTKDFFAERLEAAHRSHQFTLSAWVLMPDHVHLLLIPKLPEFPVSKLLAAIKRPFAEAVIRRWRELKAPVLGRLIDKSGATHFWQTGGGYDRNIYSEEEYWEKRRYIHLNPVRRGLVERAGDWRWSSAGWYAGQPNGPVTMGRPATGLAKTPDQWHPPEYPR